jgi:hypothetical protein
MKFALSLLFLLSFGAHAGARLTVAQQTAAVEAFAKDKRRELWRAGHEDVTSTVTRMTRAELDSLVREDRDGSAEPLDRDQISRLYRCLHSPQVCALYSVHVSSTYYSGYGVNRYWVLVAPTSGRYETIGQSIYAE